MKNRKTLALVLAVVLLLTATVAGTLAWLKDSTEEVKNTFTTSDINIDLTETTGENYKMVPGATITKDPVVTVEEGSEDCYLFVKIEKSANYGTYLEEYVVAGGWEPVGEAYPGVYWRTAKAGDAFHVLKDDQVKVLTTVTKANMEAIDGVVAEGGDAQVEIDARPTLTFTAYAIQSANLTTTDIAEIYALAIATAA